MTLGGSIEEKMAGLQNLSFGFLVSWLLLGLVGFLFVKFLKTKLASWIIDKYFGMFGLTEEKVKTIDGFLISLIVVALPGIPILIGLIFCILYFSEYISSIGLFGKVAGWVVGDRDFRPFEY